MWYVLNVFSISPFMRGCDSVKVSKNTMQSLKLRYYSCGLAAASSSFNNRGISQKWPHQKTWATKNWIEVDSALKRQIIIKAQKQKEGILLTHFITTLPFQMSTHITQTLPAKPNKTQTHRSFSNILRLQQSALYVCVICFWTERPHD